MATLQWTDGKLYDVPDDRVQQALADGFKAADPAQVVAGDQTGEAFVEGVGRGATMGLLEPLAIGVNARLSGKPESVVREERRLRRDENPLASGVGEIGGAIGVSALTGGVSALAGGGMRGAALETGLYGLGSMITESTLENTELTAEQLAAGMAGSALAGAGVHGTLSLLGKGAKVALGKVAGKGVKDALEEAAYKVEERALGEGNKTLVKKLKARGGDLRDVVEYARKNNLPIQFTDDALDVARGAIKRTGDETADFVARLDKVSPLTDDLNRTRVVDAMKKRLGDTFKGDIAAERVAEDFINAEVEPLLSRTDLKWPELYKLQSRLRGVVDTGVSPLKKEVYDAGRKTMRDIIFKEAEKIGAGSEKQLQRLQKDYAKGSFLKDAIESRIAAIRSTGGPVGIGLMDAVRGGGLGASAGAAALGPVGAPLGALVGAYANKQMRERGGSVLSSALRSLAESKVTNGVSRNLATHLGNVMAVAGDALGAYRLPLAEAAAQGADALLEKHVQLAAGPYGHDYLSKVALPVESDGEIEAAGARLAVLDAVERQALDGQQEQDHGVALLFGGGSGRRPSLDDSFSLKEFSKVRESLDGILLSPEKAFEQIPPEVAAAAPALASATAAKTVQIAQYLDSVAPKDPNAGMPPAIKPPWQPSADELDKFTAVAEAVTNPARVLKNMSQGYVSQEQLDAIRAVYPVLYQQLQQKISDRLMTWEKPLAYPQQLALSQIIGPAALGITPQQVQILQELQQQAVGSQSENGGMKPPDGRQDVDQEDNLETQAQRMEGR